MKMFINFAADNGYRLNDVKMATAETSYYGTNFNAIFILFKPLLLGEANSLFFKFLFFVGWKTF